MSKCKFAGRPFFECKNLIKSTSVFVVDFFKANKKALLYFFFFLYFFFNSDRERESQPYLKIS